MLASNSERIKLISERTPSMLASNSERIKLISERTPRNPASKSLCTATCSPQLLAERSRDAFRLLPLHACLP